MVPVEMRGAAAIGCPQMRGLSLSLLLLFASCGEGGPKAPYDADGRLVLGTVPSERRNVVFLSIDTLRADRLGCYGAERATSPHLDAFARGAVVFEEAISAAPWTTPAHISLMTGLFPEAHGVLAYPNPGVLHPGVVTLAEILSAQGWSTAGFTEGGYAKGATGLDDGFETFPSWPRDDEGFVSHELEPSRLAENTERALVWLRDHADEPFFLFFHTYEPHFEYRPPLEEIRSLAPDFDPDREAALLDAAVSAWNEGSALDARAKGVLYRHYLQGDLLARRVNRQKKLWPMLTRFVESGWRRSSTFAEDLAYITLLYDAEIRATDRAIGVLLDALDRLGLAEDTIVVVTADHGEGLMDHDELQHGFHLYRELLHIPLLLRLPGQEPARIAEPVRGVDVLPTVLDALGLPAPIAAQGTSLLPLLQGAAEPPRVAFAEGLTVRDGERDLVMVRRGPWKLVRDVKRGRDFLFDLDADPRERRDVLTDADPTLVEELRGELDRILATSRALAARYPASQGTLDDAERRRLEALGYAGAAEDE